MKWLSLFFLTACGDNLPDCERATEYLGPIESCFSARYDDEGVCIAYGPNLKCQPLCNRDGGSVCQDGEWWMTSTIINDDGSIGGVCYCEAKQ